MSYGGGDVMRAALIIHPYYKEIEEELNFVKWLSIEEKITAPEIPLSTKLKLLAEYMYDVRNLLVSFETAVTHSDTDYFWTGKSYDPFVIKVVDDKMIVKSYMFSAIDKEYAYSVEGLKQLLDDFNNTIRTYLAFLIGDILDNESLQKSFWKYYNELEDTYTKAVYDEG